MRRMNITVVEPDRTLARSIQRIDVDKVHRVGGAFRVNNGNGEIPGVLDVTQATPSSQRPVQLDLIAHARDGELHLARWVISESEGASRQLFGELAPGTLAAVRLLGCFTGQTRAGRAAMRHLKQLLKERYGNDDGNRIQVYGTLNLIGARDFEDDGFHHDYLLIEHDQLPASDLEAIGDETAWLSSLETADKRDLSAERLQPESGEAARAEAETYDPPSRWHVIPSRSDHGTIDQVLANRDGDPWPDPGLLQLPDVELLFPAPGGDRAAAFVRVTSLFGGRYLRVYPIGHPDGVLFRTKQPLAR